MYLHVFVHLPSLTYYLLTLCGGKLGRVGGREEGIGRGVMHLSSASLRGGGDPGLMRGLCKLCISKFLYISTPGNFFLAKSPVFGEAKHAIGFRNLFWFFEQLTNTQ